MSDQEKRDMEQKALTLHRYKNWVEVYRRNEVDLSTVQQQMAQLGSSMSYSLLEAREEHGKLKAMGFSDEDIDRVADLPRPPVDLTEVATRIMGKKS